MYNRGSEISSEDQNNPSGNPGNDDESGNSERDWEIFNVLCSDQVPDPPCPAIAADHHMGHSLDLVTTLRSELAASTYKRDRLLGDLSETKSALCAKESECESLRAQTARQSAMIGSLQARLQASETRERNAQTRNETTVSTFQRDKRCLEDKVKELCAKLRRVECDLSAEESQKDQIKGQFHDLLRRLCLCLGIDVCDNTILSPDVVLTKAGEIVTELQRLRTKVTATCETLTNTESELLAVKNTTTSERQRMQSQVDALKSLTEDLESRNRQLEKELHMTRDRLTDNELCGDKLREELRGFESRCGRLQNNLERFQHDRLQFLKHIANVIGVPEPCETLIKDKLKDIVGHNQQLHVQVENLREQISMEGTRHREAEETTTCRLRAEEAQRCSIEERLEKAHADLQAMRAEHTCLADYLVRLARAMCWSECTEPPAHGNDTHIMAESLLERAERNAIFFENHGGSHGDKHAFWDHHSHNHNHLPKLRRERSCHDIPLKESSVIYTLQRRVRVLREQVQRRDLHLELLRRKIALLEDGARAKAILQTERDEAIHRARRSTKNAEKNFQQLLEVKAQLAEVKAQLSEAADFKITALERSRKIDELQARLHDLESEKCKLQNQISNYKTRARSAVESSNERRCRDDQVITNLREELTRIKTSLADCNHRLQQLQAFRSSVARLMHMRDLPEADLLQRLQTLCSAHQEFTLLSRRYESASPLPDHPCPRFDHDILPPPGHCRPISSASPHHHIRRFDDFHDEHFDDEFDFAKKY
uniref:Putative myosin class ii heavy chain n=1 Tax=Lutzomyia longipalpis TaxID=7200 RepID=A0A1B0CQC2_LUTLO